MILILSDLVEQCLEILMDDFSIYGDSFEDHLTNLGKVLRRCRDKHLTLNWEKYHFTVKKGIVLGYIISSEGIHIAKVKVVNCKPLPPHLCKGHKIFSWTCWLYWRFIKDFIVIAKPLSSLLGKDTPFHLSKEYEVAITKLKRD